jgi:hypothetical protein
MDDGQRTELLVAFPPKNATATHFERELAGCAPDQRNGL